MTEPPSDARRNLATAKFNFLAWAGRNRPGKKLSAADLMVLAQLLVRFDPTRGAFQMSALALAHRTGLSELSVRGAIKRLQRLRYIEVIPKSGRSNAYRVSFDLAPPNWIKKARDDYEAKRAKAASELEPSAAAVAEPAPHPAKSLAPHPSKIGAPTPLRSEHTPLQKPSGVSIASKDRRSDSLLSMRPDGRKAVSANALQEGKNAAAAEVRPKSTSLLPKRDAVTSVGEGARLKGSAANELGSGDPFEVFLKTWPRRDADEAKLRAAWQNRVVKAGVDPSLVLKGARAWRRQRSLAPKTFVPPAGGWLAEEGWLWNLPDVHRGR